jgi:drug/metabolite transporter superfamily protein YnfA
MFESTNSGGGTFALFVVTAIAEILGCYLACLWLKKDGSPWLLVPATVSLAIVLGRAKADDRLRSMRVGGFVAPFHP